MISKEEFKKSLLEIWKAEVFLDKLSEAHFNLYENPLHDAYGYFMDRYFEAYFTEEGMDHINWFLFEHHDFSGDFDKDLNLIRRGRLSMWDENNIPMAMDTIDDLWEYVKELRK